MTAVIRELQRADAGGGRERRVADRRRSLLQGRIFFNNGRSSIDCVVRDISATGAKLAFSSAVETPALVDLHLPSKDETYPVRVAWRRDDEMGVAFLVPESPAAALDAPDLTERIERLENELARVTGLVNTLQTELSRLRGF